jgi:tetratricopeptide (TPR) repeat protein
MVHKEKTLSEKLGDFVTRCVVGAMAPLGLACIDSLVNRFFPDDLSASFAMAILTNASLHLSAFCFCWLMTPKRNWKPTRSESPWWDTEWLNLAVFVTSALVAALLAQQTRLQGYHLRLCSGAFAFTFLAATMFLKAKYAAHVYEKLAVAAFLRREYRSAVRLISEAVERDFDPSEKLQLRRAELLIGAQKFEEAVEYLTEFLEKHPDSDRAYQLRLEARTWRHEAKARAEESSIPGRNSASAYELTHTF